MSLSWYSVVSTRPGISVSAVQTPKSACPLRTACAMPSTGKSKRSTRIPGKRTRKPASKGGSRVAARSGEVATAKRPLRLSDSCRRPSKASSRFSKTFLMEGSSSSPASVSAMRRVVRSKSRTASSPSRLLISMDSADGVRCRRWAARVMLSSCATATNARNWRMVTPAGRGAFL